MAIYHPTTKWSNNQNIYQLETDGHELHRASLNGGRGQLAMLAPQINSASVTQRADTLDKTINFIPYIHIEGPETGKYIQAE